MATWRKRSIAEASPARGDYTSAIYLAFPAKEWNLPASHVATVSIQIYQMLEPGYLVDVLFRRRWPGNSGLRQGVGRVIGVWGCNRPTCFSNGNEGG
jgi:hypothetical protein